MSKSLTLNYEQNFVLASAMLPTMTSKFGKFDLMSHFTIASPIFEDRRKAAKKNVLQYKFKSLAELLFHES
jgi:hypothetical protein